ncbi:MAG: class I SAM-dependent methyltransferase [Planctomycetia bacterium]|nr:class I SAM-dependent methyltransferase [Planctomycetia bacterium]
MTTQSTTFVNDEAARVSGETLGFSFGANWKKFLVTVDEPIIGSAMQSFTAFTHLASLAPHEFLDLGCGSGLSSLVAIRLGARRVVSVDIDPHSVDCVRRLRDQENLGEDRWAVHHGSVLDEALLESLGRFSYVHSWGVLHHTGAMWRALANVVKHNVEPNALLHLALYNAHRSAPRWLRVKRLCNRSPHILFPLLKNGYLALLFGKMLAQFRSPIRFVREYHATRGMSFVRDMDDWFGGLPYEYCSPDQALDFLAERDFSMLRIKTTRSCGCNEFLFRAGGGLDPAA